MVRTITIAREYGSGGAEIARTVAAHLGWQVVDREVITRAAELARVPAKVAQAYDERRETLLERLISGVAAQFPQVVEGPASDGAFDADVMHELTEQIICSAAEAGQCVIVGRAAQCVLRHRSDTMQVFVYAPAEARIARLRIRCPQVKDVRELMADMDRQRAAYVREYYRCAWDDRELYDLCVNSALSVDTAAAIIEQAARLTGHLQ